MLDVTALAARLDRSTGPMSRRLMTALRDGIREGRLTAGLALPPSRALAAELGCSRWVVTEAYAQLVAEGYLVAAQGSATRVRDTAATAAVGDPAPLPPARRHRFDLAPGVPDLAGFPRSRWAESYRRAVLGRVTGRLADGSLVGVGEARVVLTDYLTRTRQVREDPSQLSLSTGSRAAAGWLARLLAASGHRRIGVEDPSWLGLREAARRGGLEPVPIPVDAAGLDVDRLAGTDVRAVIVTPAHQFPTGVPLSPERRVALIEWARRVDGTIIEDDYDAEFRYDRLPVATLQGMAPDRVALVGSVSKTLSSEIGVGWVILPQNLIRRILADDLERAVGPSTFAVDALAGMIGDGSYERHLRAARLRYRQRRESLLEAIARVLPECTPGGLAAGLHLTLTLPRGADAGRVVEEAAALEVGVPSMDRYRIKPAADAALVLGFGNLHSGSEDEAIERLAVAIDRAAGRGHSG